MRITQDQLIKCFQEYYQSHGEVPALNKVREKTIPCPVTHNTVVRKFGSWNNALKAAGLPLFVKPILAKEVVCCNCGKVFYKQRHRLQEGKPIFVQTHVQQLTKIAIKIMELDDLSLKIGLRSSF
jgi:hypothetical protein